MADGPAVGRSVAQFYLPAMTQEHVLAAALAFATEQDLRVENYGPNHVHLATGSIWWTGKRLLMILAWNAPEGANVQVEAWVEGLIELNANPSEFIGFVPRRAAWRLASAFVARFGVVPEAVFRHY